MENFITEYLKLPKRICLPEDTEITEELLKKILKIHDEDIGRYKICLLYTSPSPRD